MGSAYKKELEDKQLAQTTRFLIDLSPKFAALKKHVNLESGDLLHDVDSLMVTSEVEEQVLELDEQIKAFETKEWIANTAKEAKLGRKIYETPYYRDLLDRLHFMSQKKNGVGGVILYGPPGTGKTELLQEKNKEQGYKSRVINIHHYTSFEDLLASKSIQLGIDRGASLVQKLSAVVDMYQKEDPQRFMDYMQEIYNQLKIEGKVSEGQTFGSFMSSIVSAGAAEVLGERTISSKEDLTDKEREIVKSGFIDRQKARIARAALPDASQESIEDIVKGEILTAIANNERVVLDELDKAGPNSLGGILSFLAKSPGESFVIGSSKQEIPAWFSVDATSNSMDLNDYLKDRFSHFEVGMPPVKDQLMIAAVRLSDDQGNILLSDYEQKQLVGFFIYVVPEVNKVMEANKLPPLSNRSIQELTSYLVNFGKMRRTDVSFREAVKMLLVQNKLWAKDENVLNAINNMLSSYNNIVKNKPYDLSEETAPTKAHLGLKDKSESGLKSSIHSPVVLAINGLIEEPNEISEPKIVRVELHEKQKTYIQSSIEAEKTATKARGDVRELATGILLSKTTNQDGLGLYYVPGDGDLQLLLWNAIGIQGKIAAASEDGKRAVVLKPGNKGYEEPCVLTLFGQSNAELNGLGEVKAGSDVEMDMTGRFTCVLDKGDRQLLVYDKKGGKKYLQSISRFSLSKDGKLLITEDFDGKTSVMFTSSLETFADKLSGTSWRFAGENLIIQQEENNQIATKAFLLR
ncbi:MAG: hypothetical protein A2905_03180 [Candidatus Levybacteria bacterium RIFCSPLOWO2_01_FULL_36_10]|nr:MAG: hypothetical protein A2905_03180 [Candidatus Levybacteria bacterium RIFCSPLOWO2_01_FULL_36_10]